LPLAASIERAVTDSAVLLLGAGAVLALAWGLLHRRLGLLRWPVIVVALGSLGAGTALGAWAWHEDRSRTVRGSSTKEFVKTLRPKPNGPRPGSPLLSEQWPTYGYDLQRTHLAPLGWRLRPPYYGLWQVAAKDDIEFPPSVAYGNVYIPQQKGRFYVVRARTGKRVWVRHFPNCVAASPTIHEGIVYQPFMDRLPCGKHEANARGFVIAWDAHNGRPLWTFRAAGPVESSPLLVGNTLYFGSWDHKLYALTLRGRKRPRLRWTFEADDQVVAAPAYAGGTVYIATSNGSVYGVNARSGRMRWHATSFSRFGRREYFYATPTVAYGRVFVGNADGTVYAFGASTGDLLWARRVGTYVYTAAAVWKNSVYVGTWDGVFFALDARTGDIRWRFDAPASITGAPTVLAGLVYFSTCGRCGVGGSRRVKVGRHGTFALNARNGRLVWRFHDGKYSPVVSDGRRLYVTGRTHVYAFITQVRRREIKEAQAKQKRARKRRAGKRARSRSAARPGTSSGTPG
jgi:outer membrane protein assembly factor BamB